MFWAKPSILLFILKASQPLKTLHDLWQLLHRPASCYWWQKGSPPKNSRYVNVRRQSVAHVTVRQNRIWTTKRFYIITCIILQIQAVTAWPFRSLRSIYRKVTPQKEPCLLGNVTSVSWKIYRVAENRHFVSDWRSSDLNHILAFLKLLQSIIKHHLCICLQQLYKLILMCLSF